MSKIAAIKIAAVDNPVFIYVGGRLMGALGFSAGILMFVFNVALVSIAPAFIGLLINID